MFYQYNYNILNILLMGYFDYIKNNISKLVYNKIYWPEIEDNIYYMDYKEKFEKI